MNKTSYTYHIHKFASVGNGDRFNECEGTFLSQTKEVIKTIS